MRKPKQFPILKTDEEAERFVAEADLSEYDFSGFVPMDTVFEYLPKNTSITLRLPDKMLDNMKAQAQEQGIPYQRFIRQLLERALRGA